MANKRGNGGESLARRQASKTSWLEPPSPEAQARIAAHLETHGIRRFRLGERVYLGGGKRRASQIVTWNPAQATYHCERCPGMVFSTGEITAEQVMRTQLFDPGIQPFLAGPRTAEQRDEITERYLAGDIGDAVLQAARKRSRRQPAAARPSVEHRKARVREWMLERYAVHGVLERVIEEADRLPLEEWVALAGKKLAPATLRRYWQQIPDAKVDAAKRAYRAQQKPRN